MLEPLEMPAQLTLFVAFPCNLRCQNCWLFGLADYERDYMGTPDRDIMSAEVFHRAVDPLFRPGCVPSICFMGGEPTLHPKLAEWVRYIKSRGPCYVDINTNGTRLPKVGAALAQAGMDAFYVSLDGSTAAINDAGRGEGSFQKIIEGLETVLALRPRSGPKVAVNYTVTAKNYSDLVAVARLASRLQVDELFLNLCVFVTEEEGREGARTLAQELNIRFSSWQGFAIDQMVQRVEPAVLIEQLEELRSTEWGFPVFIQPVGYTPAELGEYFGHGWRGVLKEKACPVQTFRTTVLPNGDVNPCTIYPDIVVGNLRESSFSEIWHGQRYARFRQLVTRRLLPTCSRCCDLFDETKGDPMAFVNKSRLQHRISRQS